MNNGGPLPGPRPRSVVQAFRALVDTDPDRLLFTWVDDRGRDEETMTTRQLATAVDGVVAGLSAAGLQPGDRAVLVYPPSLEFIRAFVGCLAAGVLPVPVYPPNPFRLAKDLATFREIVRVSGARVALTNGTFDRSRLAGSVAGLFSNDGNRWPELRWYRTDRRHRQADPPEWRLPSTLDDTAFIQFTSGSTADPKGVMVTHGNLAHEIAANVVDLRLHQGTVGVFWIPQYHDMGLINVILSTVVGNSRTHLISPLTFLHRPSVWLDVMSRVGATVTSAPNFAYELAVRKTTAQQRAGWDLSTLEMAICAAEPVRAKTVRNFLTAFEPTGLRPEAFFTAYGLAENTASVTNRGQGRVRLDRQALAADRVALSDDDGDDTAVYFGCGRSTKPGDRIRIIDPDTRRPAPPDRVGEIWVRSTTTAAGYWGRPDLSRETFHARVTGADDPTEYLRTGDLGFLLDGELYLTGRIKDLMIIRGRNVYPADLEDSVRDCHPLIRPGGVLVFADDDERIVALVETRADRLTGAAADEIGATVRRQIYADHQLACDTVLIGRVGLAKKTTSGKLRRRVCRQEFVSGELTSSPAVLRIWTAAGFGAVR